MKKLFLLKIETKKKKENLRGYSKGEESVIGKFKQGIVSEVKKQRAEEEKQKILHNKYDVKKDIMIVEKNNMAKYMVNLLLSGIRLFCTIGILILAVIGLMVLVYPNIREQFLMVSREIYSNLQIMLR